MIYAPLIQSQVIINLNNANQAQVTVMYCKSQTLVLMTESFRITETPAQMSNRLF